MGWQYVTEVGVHVMTGIPALAASLIVLVAARQLFLVTTAFRVNEDLVDAENAAVGVVFAAYLLGVAIALTGAFFGFDDQGALIAAAEVLVEGAVVGVLLRLSIWIQDRFILRRFRIEKEIREDGNLGAAFCVAGSCIACGLILNGALTGYSASFLVGLRDVAIFWLLGQGALLAGAWIYTRLARYDVHQLIEYDDNVAVGVGFGVFLITLGIVVRASLVGAGLDLLSRELPRTLLLALIGVVSMACVNTLAMRLVAPFAKYEDEVEMHGNVALSAASASASLAMAMLIASVIQR